MKISYLLCVIALSFVSVTKAETTLKKLLEHAKTTPKKTVSLKPLSQQWVGDLKGENDFVRKLRFDHGSYRNGKVSLCRARNNTYSGEYYYIEKLPSIEEIKKCKFVSDIEKLLGPNEIIIRDGWGSADRINSQASWGKITLLETGELKVLSIFAHVSWTEEQRKKGVEQVNQLDIEQGIFRPADPNSKQEKLEYLSGEDEFQKRQQDKQNARAKYPLPLRNLLKADDAPDDYDLKELTKTLQAVRDKPDPLLLKQIIMEMHEGTRRIRGLLNHLLVNKRGFLKLDPWTIKNKDLVMKTCIDLIHLSKDRKHLINIILQASGGGEIDISIGKKHYRVGVKMTKDSVSSSFGGVKGERLTYEQGKKALWDNYKKRQKENKNQ